MRTPSLLGVVLSGCAAALFTFHIALPYYRLHRYRSRKWLPVTGKVVSRVRYQNSIRVTGPLVRYTFDEQVIRSLVDLGEAASVLFHRRGAKMRLLIDPENPSVSFPASFANVIWLFLIVAGLLTGLVGAIWSYELAVMKH